MALIRIFPYLLLMILVGCSAAPQKELSLARGELARAYSAGAHQLAPAKYQDASQTLEKGEESYRLGDYQKAEEQLPLAAFKARVARNAAKAARERQAAASAPEPPLTSAPETGTTARPATKTVVLPTMPSQATKSPPKEEASNSKPASPPPPPTEHVVGEGETLWTISARKEVYADALLWPLIYKANRDQIKDPRQIYPGQVLAIPREFSLAEGEEAREKAKASQIFPIPPPSSN